MVLISFSVTESIYNIRAYETGMLRKMMDRICCPACKGQLALKVGEENEVEILTGTLSCGKCAITYPIENGIPDLVKAEMKVNRK